MGKRRVSFLYRVFVVLLIPAITVVTRRTWSGGEHVPREGGFIAVSNHVSDLDPITFGHFLLSHGAPPHYMAKDSLFRVPIFGWMFKHANQIPVYRGTAQASESLVAAEAALAEGKCVAMYPEGTLTRDPDMWPMTSRPGVGRLALTTRAPVIPVAQWGAHRIIPRYHIRPRIFPRKKVSVLAGPPVDLSDLYDQPLESAVLTEATERIMAALTAGVAEIRGKTPPQRPYDLRRDGDPLLEQDSWAGRRARASQGRKAKKREERAG